MKTLKLGLILAIGLALMLVVLQNTARVQGHFLWMTFEVPVVVLLFLTTTGGFVAGLLVALLVRRGGPSGGSANRGEGGGPREAGPDR